MLQKKSKDLLIAVIITSALIFVFVLILTKTVFSKSGGGKIINSPEALEKFLKSLDYNEPEDPIQISIAVNKRTLESVAHIINNSNIYINLDLSGSDLTYIPERAFSFSEALVSINIPDGVTGIGDMAFRKCYNLTDITIPNSVIEIGLGAFDNCICLTGVTIPDGVINIGNAAFNDCTRLAAITISNSVTNIGEFAFSNCTGLTGITIPESVISIGNLAFWGCTGLAAINVDAGNTAYSSQDGVLYNKNKTTLILYPPEKEKSAFTIPDTVTVIEDGSFSGCANLTGVTIPNSVTIIGEYAFGGCDNLTAVTIPSGVAFIGEFAFTHCSRLTSVTFQGVITPDNIGSFFQPEDFDYVSYDSLEDDLRAKYLAGGIGTYITTAPVDANSKWTKIK